MKQLITESEAVGKVVESVEIYDEFLTIVFTDDTVLLGRASDLWGMPELNVITELTDPYDQLTAGIITQEEYDKALAKARRKEKKAAVARERAHYERLRAKFDK